MPTIFDNIEIPLLSSLRQSLTCAYRGDFCVGYFNLRGWKQISDLVDNWDGGDNKCCRLLVGMYSNPKDSIKKEYSFAKAEAMDNKQAKEQRRILAQEFKDQLTIGYPTDEDEKGLRKLSEQLKHGKLKVKLFLGHPLHAKL